MNTYSVWVQTYTAAAVQKRETAMADNRVARGIVLVPCLLLGGAFLATAVWGQGVAAENRTLAASIGSGLVLAGLLAQWRSSDESTVTKQDGSESNP